MLAEEHGLRKSLKSKSIGEEPIVGKENPCQKVYARLHRIRTCNWT